MSRTQSFISFLDTDPLSEELGKSDSEIADVWISNMVSVFSFPFIDFPARSELDPQ